MTKWTILEGDVRHELQQIPDGIVQTCVTSPPYFGLRDYGHDGQIGLEATPDAFVNELVDVFREIKRVLRNDGTLWLNLGDSYSGSGKGPAGNLGSTNDERNMQHTISSKNVPKGLKPKDLIGIPWRVAFALQADGWYLRQDIIWHKPNTMPESVTDRCTKAHEYVFLFSKSARYFFDSEAISEKSSYEGKRNKRSVWSINTQPYKEAHFATFPEALVEPCIQAGSKMGDLVLDPFTGSGTTGAVAVRNKRHFVGCELNPEYRTLAVQRIFKVDSLFTVEACPWA